MTVRPDHGSQVRRLSRREVLRSVKHLRRAVYEGLGSRRASRPALYDLDSKLAPYLPDRPGTFVEVGANDGYTQSNTYYLERWRGWRGVLVEPVPHLYEVCRRLRRRSSCWNCALVDTDHDSDHVTLRYADLMSLVPGARGGPEADARHIEAGTLSNRVTTFDVVVPARTMASVLDEAGLTTIDLMVVDTEGYEAPVLRGAALDRHRPQLILVEVNDGAVEALLSTWYERVADLTHHDALFRRRPGL